MKTILRIVCVAALTCSSLFADAGNTWFKGPKAARISFRLTPDGKPFVKVRLSGRDSFLFIDTGATTILDKSIAESIGLALRETSDVATGLTGIAGRRYVSSVDLQIGEMKISNLPVSCLDLTALRELNRSQGIPELDGVIGSDLLAILKAQIDFGASALTVKRPTRL